MKFGKKNLQKQIKELSSPRRSFENWFSMVIFRILIVAIVIFVGVGLYSGFRYLKDIVSKAPEISQLEEEQDTVTKVLYTDGNVAEQFSLQDTENAYVALSQIPEEVQEAFVAYLDPDFYQNSGTDFKGILRVIFKRGSKASSKSITKRLVNDNIYLGWEYYDNPTGIRQTMMEEYLVKKVENAHEKDWILERYLNYVNLGQGCVGVESASERYFGKNVSQLTASEGAVLAAIVGHPSTYDPVNHESKNAKARAKVLKDMYDQGYLDEASYEKLLKVPVYNYVQKVSATGMSEEDSNKLGFARDLKSQVISDLQDRLSYSREQAENLFERGGLTIYSTLDESMQTTCESAIKKQTDKIQETRYSVKYELSVRESDGRISNYTQEDMLAYYKKEDQEAELMYADCQEAKDAVREFRRSVLEKGGKKCGENLVYMLEPQLSITIVNSKTGAIQAMISGRALAGETRGGINRSSYEFTRKAGITLLPLTTFATALDGGNYTLATEVGDTKTSLHEAIAGSNLTTSGILYDYFGNEAVGETATSFQLKAAKDIYANKEKIQDMKTSNLELSLAYAALSDAGDYSEPIYYSKICDRNGNVLLKAKHTSRSTVREATAYLLTKSLESENDDLKNAAYILSQCPTDVWSIGYTNNMVCTLWGGNDNGSKLVNSRFAKEIWKDVMKSLPIGKQTAFVKPGNVEKRSICPESGQLAITGVCPNARMEYFTKNTQSEENCQVHQVAMICKKSGLLAGDKCPENQVEKRVYNVELPSGKMPEQVCNLH